MEAATGLNRGCLSGQTSRATNLGVGAHEAVVIEAKVREEVVEARVEGLRRAEMAPEGIARVHDLGLVVEREHRVCRRGVMVPHLPPLRDGSWAQARHMRYKDHPVVALAHHVHEATHHFAHRASGGWGP